MIKISKLLFFVSLMMVFYLGNLNAYGRYLQQDESKGIQPAEYLKKRPPVNRMRRGNRPNPPKKRYYRFVKSKKPTNSGKTDPKKPGRNSSKTMEKAVLGFTMWRFQPASAEDESKGLTEVNQQSGKPQRAERIEAETALAVGERVRLQIESLSHNGYLYVIDREKFADGTYGEAKLVFPTLNSRGGNNYVKAGVLTFVPAYPNAFEITTNTEKKQVAEELTIIVSPKPLINPALLKKEQITITTDDLMEWVNKWEVDEVKRELDGGVGQIISLAEQTAGKNQTKGLNEVKQMLTQDDEPPQTVFDMKIKRGNPLLTRIILQIKPD